MYAQLTRCSSAVAELLVVTSTVTTKRRRRQIVDFDFDASVNGILVLLATPHFLFAVQLV